MTIGFGMLLVMNFGRIYYPYSLIMVLYWGWQVYDFIRRAKKGKVLMTSRKEFKYLSVAAIGVIIAFGSVQQYYISVFYSSIKEPLEKVYRVARSNMQPTLNLGDVVVLDSINSPYNSVRPGDIIIYKTHNGSKVAIQRVMDIQTDSNGVSLAKTKGDTEPSSEDRSEDQTNKANYIGKVAKVYPISDAIPPIFKNWLWAHILTSAIAVLFYLQSRRKELQAQTL